MPRIGKMDQRIIIQQNTPSRDSVGQDVPSWSELDTVWAQVLPTSGSEGQDMQQELAQQTYKFIIRYRSDVTPKHRISYENSTYDIEVVSEVYRKKAIEIIARRNVA